MAPRQQAEYVGVGLFRLLWCRVFSTVGVAGYEVTLLEDVVSRAHLFVTATGCEGIIRPEHMRAMRDDAIVCNIGHFDCEINTAWLKENCKRVEIKPQVNKRDCVFVAN